MRSPFIVDDAVVVSRRVRLTPFAKVEVPAPCTMRFPVVVAPPEMVRPPAWVPAPIVVDAVESRPFENVSLVVVASFGNKYPNVGKPRLEVAVSAYPPEELPTRICPKVGAVERPVPP